MKLHPLTVYRFALGDCTNGGASAKSNTLYIPHPDGHVDPAQVDPSLIFTPEHRGGDYWAIVPTVDRPGTCGPMMGGNLALGDSRDGGRVYRVHDRFETWVAYEALSR